MLAADVFICFLSNLFGLLVHIPGFQGSDVVVTSGRLTLGGCGRRSHHGHSHTCMHRSQSILSAPLSAWRSGPLVLSRSRVRATRSVLILAPGGITLSLRSAGAYQALLDRLVSQRSISFRLLIPGLLMRMALSWRFLA